MKLIREATGQDIQWIRVNRRKREFELHAGDEVLARLYPQKGSRQIIGEAADGQWAFERRSFWNSDILVTELPSQVEIAVAKCGRKKRMIFSDSHTFTLNKPSFWRNEWIWFNDEGIPLIHFQRNKQLIIEPSALALPELSLLVLLGWHLIMLQQEVDATTAATIAAWA